jgi:hypothetical protein
MLYQTETIDINQCEGGNVDDYYFLKIYRGFLTVALIIFIVSSVQTACAQLADVRYGVISAIVEVFLPAALITLGVFATIQIITRIIKNDEEQRVLYHDLLSKNKAVIERVDRLEKANAELTARLRSLSDQQAKQS